MTTDHEITTRFAPSPTGFLHIGGARTALFNWLYARGRGGRFLLRIEDTDRARSTQDAVDAILDGLAWLGLDWDGEPVSQASRAAEHVAAAERLLAEGKAYTCWLGGDELDAAKAAARDAGEALRSPWRDRDPSEGPAAPGVVRFKGPRDGETVIEDEIQGRIVLQNKDLDDLVLLRSDGAPTYNLAVVVDDHDMGVTHVVRGDDHLTNATRQTLIYQALGWTPPRFAHVPLIHGPDGKKLSKRHGALGAEAYRDMGFLPEGLRNYLLRLGWSHGDQEFFTDAEAQQLFDIAGINKAPARLDLDKLASVNAWHMKRADDARLADLAAAVFRDRHRDAAFGADGRAKLLAAMPLLKERAKTTLELADQAEFLFLPRPIALEGKAGKALDADAVERLKRLKTRLESAKDWSDAALKSELDAFAVSEDVGFGKIGGPLRAALTGGAPAPDISAVLELIGRDESLARLGDALAVR